jgi:hypothetical protein
MRRLLRMGLVSALGLFAIASGREAKADFETFTATVPQTTTDFTVPLLIQGFDPALGTLTKVMLTWSVSGSMNGTVTNTSTGAQNFTVAENSTLKLYLGSDLTVPPLSSPGLSAMQTYTNLGSGITSPFGPYMPSSLDGPNTYTSASNPMIFNGFISAGTVAFTVDTMTKLNIDGGGGNVLSAILTTAGGTLTVRYDFTPVPEPSSIALSLVGVLTVGTGALVRRRKIGR